MANQPAAALQQRARRSLERSRPIAAALSLSGDHVNLIDQSHERCLALGLSRIDSPDFSLLGRSDMSVARERNLRLHGHAAPVMEMLYEQIVNTSNMVVLTDATGTVIHSIGDDDFLERAAKVALAPGANWSEACKGTNAVGTALVSEGPTLVHADEHFLHANHFLTCSAAPIMDPRGNILGVLDVSGDRRSYHQHTMALVKMSARMIENQWLTDHHRHAMRLHFHSKLGFIGTLMEGILAVTPEGRIVGANRSALDELGLSSSALRMQTLTSLFGTHVGALVDHFRSPLATPLALSSGPARHFHVLARFDWPVWSQVADAAAAAASTAGPATSATLASPLTPLTPLTCANAAEPAPLGLTALQTGDPEVDALLGRLQLVKDTAIPVLLCGETGTGKEWLARAIHAESLRARQPFVAVCCRSETVSLGDLFQKAQRGTLFFDEIGDMPAPLQIQLLRLLDEPHATPPAIICSTQVQLRALVDVHGFRQDLYYRLNGLAVRVPALRERADVSVLARRMLDAFEGGRDVGLDDEVQSLIQGHDWPGNLRQLFNVLRAACVMAGSEGQICIEHLPEDFLDETRAARAQALGAASRSQEDTVHKPLQELERDAIARALQESGGNISAAAKQLGVSRNTLYRRLR